MEKQQLGRSVRPPAIGRASLGFREGVSSVHTSRTMMLAELSLTLDNVPVEATQADYLTAIVADNVLGKPTQATRQRTADRLRELYGLDPVCTLFRLLRTFWLANKTNQPMLAFLTAVARDAILRETTPHVLAVPLGETFPPVAAGEFLDVMYPGRFSSATRKSTAQNLASSWTQAGFLNGKLNKQRTRPAVNPAVAAFAVVLGYLWGLRGKLLLDSAWTRLLDRPVSEVADLLAEASRQGWLNYKAAGSVVEITFPGLLRPYEERAAYEQD